MPDDTQTGQIDPQAVMDEEKQPSAMPTEEKPTDDGLELPDGVSERTAEQFNKLKEQLRKEREEKEALLQQVTPHAPVQSVLDDLRPSADHLSQQQVDQIAEKFVDENGYVNVDALNKALATANELSKKAQLEAQQAREQVRRMEEKEQVREAHKAYPQLDPHSEQFDQRFFDLVRNELIGQMMKGEQDVVKAAKKVSGLYTPQDVLKVKEQAVTEYKQKTTRRDQANPVPGSGKGQHTQIDQEELVKRTRSGDRDALYKRLQASGY